MGKQWIVFLITTTLVLTSCRSPLYNQTQGNVADVKLKTIAAIKKSNDSAKPSPSLVVKDGLYVDTSPINLDRQPSWLKNRVVIRGDQLPFSYYSRTIAGGAGSTILTKYQNGLDPSTVVSLSYTGSVKGALDLLASKTGYVYSIEGSKIYWQAFVTKTFDIAFIPGDTDYLMGKTSGGSASSGGTGAGGGGGTSQDFTTSDSSDAEYSNITGKLSIWDDLNSTIGHMLSPDGKVTVSRASTTVTVKDRPTNVQLVGTYIRNLNTNLSKQVLVKVQVLEINLQEDYNFGIDWQMIARAFHNSPFIVNGSYGTPITISNVFSGQTGFPASPNPAAPTYPQLGTQSNGGIPSYTILFNALNQQGKTSVVTEPRVVCLNNQVSVIRIVDSEGYVASIQNTSTGGGGTSTAAQNTVTSQITPGTVITGLTLYILPKILGKDIYMQVNADLSTNRGITTFTSGSGSTASSVQLPNITEKHFNQRSVIRSGETLILAGFRQVGNQANANQFFKWQSLGGQGSQQINKETIILITPIILSVRGSA